MPLMTYDQWMRRTRRGPTKPRSEELRSVDFALRNYTDTPNPATLDLLAAAAGLWAASKDNPERSIRNSDGAVTELLAGIRAAKQGRPASTAAPAGRIVPPPTDAPPPRPGSRIVPPPSDLPPPRPGAAATVLKSCGIVKHPNRDNVTWEGFAADKVQTFSRAFDRALEAAVLAAESMRRVGQSRSGPARDLYVKYFGEVDEDAMPKMAHSAGLMVVAMKTRPMTFVLRAPKPQFDYENPAPDKRSTSLGMVFAAGGDENHFPHHTGSGMRIYIGKTVQDNASDDFYSTHTIYHEVSHKVIETSDFGEAPNGKVVDVYGERRCLNLARRKPEHARQLADAWAFYAMSFLKGQPG